MNGQTALESAYQVVYVGALIILAVMLMLCLLRAIKGPRVADRLVAVNMMGTMVIVTIAILAIMKDESYLVDISMIYAMISFLAVIVLSKVIIGVHKEKEVTEQSAEGKEKEENAS